MTAASSGAVELVEQVANDITAVLYMADSGEDAMAEIRAMLAALVADVLTDLASNYPADVFPSDSDSRDAIAGTALRTVLTAQAQRWRAGRDG